MERLMKMMLGMVMMNEKKKKMKERMEENTM